MMCHHESCECGVCKVPHFERNNYFHGKTLSARDLAAEQYYFNEKRWLINRTILGWGVVCGLNVCPEDSCLVVTPGLALDCCGRELLVCERETLHACKIADELNVDIAAKSEPLRWGLCLEYRECRTEQVKLPPSCDQKERGREYNRIRDDYRLSVRRWKDACPEDLSQTDCPHEKLGRETSIQEALVKKARKCPECKDCECVLLATGTLETQPGQDPVISLDPDAWKYRRVVYTNSALASLLRCFHEGLAHIKEVNWNPGRHFSVEDFLELLEHPLHVTFDQPMGHKSVTNPRSCRLSVFLSHDGNGCPTQFLIPVERIEYEDPTAKYYFNHECIWQELRDHCKRRNRPAEVELILHGSMILDKNNRGLDAELIHEFPTGNGVEGGDFIAYFTVGP
jgi:hypothetical protein